MSRYWWSALRSSVLVSVLISLIGLAACGGGSSASSSGNGGNGGSNNPPLSVSITISPTSAVLSSGATQQFQAHVTGSTNTSVQWQVNGVAGGDTQHGTISSTGLYTAPTTDVSVQITVAAVASADPTKTANATVTVNPITLPPPPPVVAISVSPSSAIMPVNGMLQFTATVTGTDNTAVTWTVDGVAGGNSTVGSINSTGLYTAPSSVGSHTVTATSAADPTKSASAAVTIISLSVSPQNTSVAPFGTRQFTASVQGTGDDGVTWSVDGVAGGNDAVGTITAGGLYIAPANLGSHTVTATSVDLPTYSVNATAMVVNAPPGTISVLTYHNDHVRDGANSSETVLNESNVNPQQFGKIAALPVDAQIYAQPLYVPNVTIGGVRHNVVFVATENDTVYAFDADGLSDSALWEKHLATAFQNQDSEGIQPLLGITSTPVIDAPSSTMYVVTDGTENGHKVFRLHALDLSTGNEKLGGPVIVTGTVPGNGWDSSNGHITLESSCYQRDGLALNSASNAIYINFG